ncbi:insulinase family protein [Gallaecimonas kandeliae]|uniref:insulinase family protein n=1 Tax=Gallaecimonas kandeliae TaxID=3029055 RepID=UPI00264A09E7|nr:insulinase family protein [Gallaecimonas kandeliae]WKE65773.1 insulinase family protein [Gallaecimonas kandeliae]
MRFRTLPLAAMLGLALLGGCQSTQQAQDPNQIITSPADTLSYRYLRLDNGLRVVLASDPNADKAAASLVVHVGSTADPKDREGLAHFLEHMLFISTAKYPIVDDYAKFVEAHGGSTNAGTGQVDTNFYFDIAPDQFAPALDRFAQFFIAPTLDPKYVEREKHAVYSEYELKKKDDGRRINEVLKATANPANPASQFSVGDLKTLADRPGDKVWSDLKAFHDKYYHAGNMTLALVGKGSLDQLEALARKTFSAIPAGKPNPVNPSARPFLPDQLGVRIDQSPLKDQRSLSLQFPVPNSQSYYLAKPLDYIAQLLSNAAPGGLYTSLKQKGWVDNMSAYHYGPDDYEVFYLDYSLTEEGAKHIDEITLASFGYIHKLAKQGVTAQYFDELRKAGNLDFRFQEKAEPVSLANYLASNLQRVAPANLMNAGFVYQDFEPELIQRYLGRLVPDNLRQLVVLPGAKTDKVEPHYQAPYAIQALSPKLLADWAGAQSDLKLPPPNPYLPDDPRLKAMASNRSEPVKVMDQPGLEVWALQDGEFRVPKVEKRVGIFRPIGNLTDSAMNSLYAALVNEALESESYPAGQAGLYFNLDATARGLSYSLSGYDEKQPLLEDKIWTALALPGLTQAKFQQYRDNLVRDWRNVRQEWPIKQLMTSVGSAFLQEAYPPADKAGALAKVNFRQFRGFVDQYFDQLHVQAMALGNLTDAEAGSWGKSLDNLLLRTARRIDKPQIHYAQLPKGQEVDRFFKVDHHDSAIALVYQGHGQDAEAQARFALLGHIMGPAFFAKLRTEQQLGYVVQAAYSALGRDPALLMLIQSPAADPHALLSHIDAFGGDFKAELEAMTDEQFAGQKAGLINSITQADKQLGDKADRYWGYVAGNRPFNWRVQLAQAVQMLTKEQLLAFYQQAILDKGTGRFVIWSQGQQPSTGPMPKACTDQACLDRLWHYQAE